MSRFFNEKRNAKENKAMLRSKLDLQDKSDS